MLTINRVAPDRLDMVISGKLHSDDMRRVLDEYVAKSDGIEAGKMLCDVADYQLPSLGAVAVEFSQMPRLLRVVGKFRRAAVLTDETWLKKISELEGHLIPGLEIRAFKRNERAEAEAWLNESPLDYAPS